jgi:hypothetical protein
MGRGKLVAKDRQNAVKTPWRVDFQQKTVAGGLRATTEFAGNTPSLLSCNSICC